MATDEETAAFFDAVAERYDRTFALGGALSKARLAKMLDVLGARRRVLVLGVGTGRELPALYDAGKSVVAVELSRAMAGVCARRRRSPEILMQSFYDPLPLDTHSVDAVIALHGTLAHAPEAARIGQLAGEVARVLSDGGVFYAEVPSIDGLRIVAGAMPDVFRIDGHGGFVHNDASGLRIDGRAYAPGQWHAWLDEHFVTDIAALSESELRIVGERRPR